MQRGVDIENLFQHGIFGPLNNALLANPTSPNNQERLVGWPLSCGPMDCSTPGSSILHHLLEFAQIHVHCISGALWPCHPLLCSSPFVFNLSEHWVLFLWVSSSRGWSIGASASASVLPMNIWGWFPLGLTSLNSLLSKGLSGVLFSCC